MATIDDEYRGAVHKSINELLNDEAVRLNHSKPSNVSICMVPDTLRHLHPTAYTPKIFSIGPLHKSDQRLRVMEAHKVTYMYQLFHRTIEYSMKKDIETMTQECVQAMLGLDTRARACYAPSVANFENLKFAEMMVIDGCFILELLYRFVTKIPKGDPIFDNKLTLQEVKSDLLLLENQIPLFILQVLFNLTLKRISNSHSLINFILSFFEDMNILHNAEFPIMHEKVEYCHILGLLQSCYRPTNTKAGKYPTNSVSATEIAGAGVTFKARKDENFLLAVTFSQSPIVP